MAVGRPIPHTAHLRDCSTGSIGYSYEVRPTFRLLPWAISPTHCTTRSQLTIIESIVQRRLRQCMPYCIRPRLRYYKRSYSFNPQSRFPDHSAESTGGLHRPNGILSRTSKTLTPWLQHRDRESNPGPTNGRKRSQDCATEPQKTYTVASSCHFEVVAWNRNVHTNCDRTVPLDAIGQENV